MRSSGWTRPGYLDGERSIRAAMKRAVDLDVHVDGTLRELVSQALSRHAAWP
jgi:hypothetical protein